MNPWGQNMSCRSFDLIVFDWEGTLSDPTALVVKSLQAALISAGAQPPPPSQLLPVLGMGLHQAFAHIAPTVSLTRYPDMAAAYRRCHMAHRHDTMLFAGVLAMLQDLKHRRHQLAIATGKSRRSLNDVLTQPALQSLFDATRTADETHHKPHPQMLHELMSECAVAPERTLMIGDSVVDMQMAHHAGCTSVGVGYHTPIVPALFAPWQPKALLYSIAELHTWLRHHA